VLIPRAGNGNFLRYKNRRHEIGHSPMAGGGIVEGETPFQRHRAATVDRALYGNDIEVRVAGSYDDRLRRYASCERGNRDSSKQESM
jgi:hypothetical protein